MKLKELKQLLESSKGKREVKKEISAQELINQVELNLREVKNE